MKNPGERTEVVMKPDVIGKVEKKVKTAAGLFWADYGNLGGQVRELEEAGVDWIHLEIEAQLQMIRPTFDLYRQLEDNGADLKRMHDMIAEAGREKEVELMEDGGIGVSNSARFVEVGLTVGEYSSAFLKGPEGDGPGGRGAGFHHRNLSLSLPLFESRLCSITIGVSNCALQCIFE